MVDLVVVLEEMGRVVMPGPFFATAILGGLAIDLGGSGGAEAAVSAGVCAEGTLKATLAQVEESGRWDADGIALPAKADGRRLHALSGTKLFVHDAHNADLLIVAGAHRRQGHRRASRCSSSTPRPRASASAC